MNVSYSEYIYLYHVYILIVDMNIIKKYYTNLLNCFPNTLAGTLEVMGTQLDDIPDELVDRMRDAPGIAEANELLLDYLISQLHDGQSVYAFSEMLDQFAASVSEKVEIIEAFRNGWFNLLHELLPI